MKHLMLFLNITKMFSIAIGKHNLTVLTMLPMSQNGQLLHVACNAAFNLVVENVNSRNDILTNYQLVLDVKNEGPFATLANADLVNFNRNAEVNNVMISPAVLGPTMACHFSGSTAKMLGFVSFSPNCHGPYIVERKKAFYLFSLQAPALNLIHAMLAFIIEVGKWSEIAIVTIRSNPNFVLMAEYLHEQATQQNIDVLTYSSEYEMSLDSMMVLKASRARIIAAMIIEGPSCAQFLCFAYQAGLRPPTYVFVFITFSCMFVDYTNVPLPEGCTVEMVKEQMTAMFSAGGSLEPAQMYEMPSLGYGYDTFQRKFRETTDGMPIPDYGNRLTCHDTMMVLALALNKTDEVLEANYNKSLLDFHKSPQLVQKVLVQSVLELDYVSLRTGPLKFNSQGDISENYILGQRVNGSMRYIIKTKRNGSDLLIDHIADPVWVGYGGKAPKDLSKVESRMLRSPLELVFVIAIIALTSSITQLVRSVKCKENAVFKWSLTMGCLILNVSSAVLMVGHYYFASLECRIRPILLVLGLSLMNGYFLGISHKHQFYVRKKRTVRGVSGRFVANAGTVLEKRKSRHSFVEKTKHQSKRLVFLCMSIVLPVLVSWVIVDPMSIETITSLTDFDKVKDTYFEITWTKCSSNSLTSWLIAHILLQTVILFTSLWLAYSANVKNRHHKNKRLMVAIGNGLTLFLITILILIALDSDEDERFQLTVLSFACLIYSTSIHFLCVPNLISKLF